MNNILHIPTTWHFKFGKLRLLWSINCLIDTPYHDFGKDHVTLEAIDVVVGVADDKEAK